MQEGHDDIQRNIAGNIKKRVKAVSDTGEAGSIRDIYTMLFKYKGIMPDTVARQNPVLLFGMLDGLGNSSEDSEKAEIPPELEFFYGL